jgi:hypothetical protein
VSSEALTVVEKLRAAGLVPAPRAARLARIARAELVSVRTELRLALYAGVLLVVAGVGVVVEENLARLGALTIASALTLAVAACFFWVGRHAPRFTWGEAPAAHLAFDYILLLGVLLGAADLAFVEARWTPLGPAWSWHLLLVSLAAALVALRYDSRIVFSLSLTTFAAWRGVSVQLSERGIGRLLDPSGRLRADAIGCAVLFLLLGLLLLRTGRKAHFEPVASHLGWLLLLGALVSGIGTRSAADLVWTLALLVTAAALGFGAARARRFALLAMGFVAAFVAVSALFHRLDPPLVVAAAWYLLASLALIAGLAWVQRRLREEA